MNGLLQRTGLFLACALGTVSMGCQSTGVGLMPPPAGTCKQAAGHNNMDIYDPCWFERHGALSQREVNRAFAPQVLNGHVLDQTVWNHHFEPGTAKLTEGGAAHLEYVSRRRPEPDRTVYLASAMDLQYDPNCPERYAGARQELDSLRVAAVQKFLVGLNAGRGQDFQVLVHDPADVTIGAAIPQPPMMATGVQGAVNQMYFRFRGGLLGGGGQGGAAGGGGAAVGGGGR